MTNSNIFTDKSHKEHRTLRNSFYLKSSLEDVLYAAPSFVIEEECGEIVRYRKTKITFNSFHSDGKTSWISPEIDTINLLDFCSRERYPFNSLLEKGYDSYFIRLFAQNELHNTPFKDPEYNNVLLKRTTTVTSESINTYHYHLDGGFLLFQRILSLDPDFWLQLLKACNETDLIRIGQLHIAADSTKDLMKYVSDSIKKGHFETNGLKPYGFYTLNGKKYKGSMGKYSQERKTFQDKVFEIESLYLGQTRRQAVSVVFYDKEKEEMEPSDTISPSKTRIEIRFNGQASQDLPPAFLESIVRSYYVQNGVGFRTRVFLHFLTHSIRFTNHLRSTEATQMSNWWRHSVLIPLYHASLDMFPGPINAYLTGEKLLAVPASTKLLSENKTKRGRGRPRGKKDSKPRKPRKENKN